MKKTIFLIALAIAIFSSCNKNTTPTPTGATVYGHWSVDSSMVNGGVINLVADSQSWTINQTSTNGGVINFSTTAETFTQVKDTLESLSTSYLVVTNTSNKLVVLVVTKVGTNNFYQITPGDTAYTYLHK